MLLLESTLAHAGLGARRNKGIERRGHGEGDGVGVPVAVEVDDPVAGDKFLGAKVGGGEAGLEVGVVEELGRAAPGPTPGRGDGGRHVEDHGDVGPAGEAVALADPYAVIAARSASEAPAAVIDW